MLPPAVKKKFSENCAWTAAGWKSSRLVEAVKENCYSRLFSLIDSCLMLETLSELRAAPSFPQAAVSEANLWLYSPSQ